MWREKYIPETKSSSKTIYLERRYAKKDQILNTVKSLEVSPNVHSVDPRGLALYINTKIFNADVAQYRISKSVSNHALANMRNPGSMSLKNLFAQVDSSMVKSGKRGWFTSFDLDLEDKSSESKDTLRYKLTSFLEGLNQKGCFFLIETHGGFHLHVKFKNLEKEIQKSFFQNINSTFEVDKTGSGDTPLPGGLQGGFVPNLYIL